MQLSYILIPLAILLYFKYPEHILYHIICIGIIGTHDTYLQYKNKQINNELDKKIIETIGLDAFFMISFLIHLACLMALKDIYKYPHTNISLVLLFVANIVIYYLPYWPYYLSKPQIMLYYNSIYALLALFRCIPFR